MYDWSPTNVGIDTELLWGWSKQFSLKTLIFNSTFLIIEWKLENLKVCLESSWFSLQIDVWSIYFCELLIWTSPIRWPEKMAGVRAQVVCWRCPDHMIPWPCYNMLHPLWLPLVCVHWLRPMVEVMCVAIRSSISINEGDLVTLIFLINFIFPNYFFNTIFL